MAKHFVFMIAYGTEEIHAAMGNVCAHDEKNRLKGKTQSFEMRKWARSSSTWAIWATRLFSTGKQELEDLALSNTRAALETASQSWRCSGAADREQPRVKELWQGAAYAGPLWPCGLL